MRRGVPVEETLKKNFGLNPAVLRVRMYRNRNRILEPGMGIEPTSATIAPILRVAASLCLLQPAA